MRAPAEFTTTLSGPNETGSLIGLLSVNRNGLTLQNTRILPANLNLSQSFRQESHVNINIRSYKSEVIVELQPLVSIILFRTSFLFSSSDFSFDFNPKTSPVNTHRDQIHFKPLDQIENIP